MTQESDLLKKIKASMFTSCEDALFFSDDETQLISAEYLLTVNTAKAIKELNTYFGTPYKICLENNTKQFSTACTPSLKLDKNFNSIHQARNNTKRSGRIDIAVYTHDNVSYVPVCAIEIKGFNPPKSLVIKDIERNSEYFSFVSPTGSSILPFAFFIALYSYKNVWNNETEALNISKIENRYKKYISSVANINHLSHDVNVFTIRRGYIPNPDDPNVQENGLQGDEDYHFIGVVVTTKKTNKAIKRN